MIPLRIPGRFNGPPGSANGGYAAALIAKGWHPVTTVRLHRPPPLDAPLRLERDEERATLWADDGVLATARPGSFSGEVPPAPSVQAAEAASAGYAGHRQHAFPGCFVCGPERAPQDGLRLFPGPVEGREVVATPWRPGGEGPVPTELLWAALDCPSFFGLRLDFTRPILLGEMTAEVPTDLAPDQTYVVYGWRRGEPDDRRHFAAAALADAAGRVLARAEHVWFDTAA